MTIRSSGIEFMPLSWNFVCDGMWGHIYFLVPKGTFEPGTNNGAYALQDVPASVISEIEYAGDLDWDKYQLVHAATPCMVIGEDDCGDYCENHKLGDILQAAADFICENL
jgi:hypothetical protein